MTDRPNASTPVEIIPSVQGGLSAIASATAPFIYFDGAPFFGLFNGAGQITVEATRLIALAPNNKVALDRVIVAHLRGSIPALKALRHAIDGILLMAEPKPEGQAN